MCFVVKRYSGWIHSLGTLLYYKAVIVLCGRSYLTKLMYDVVMPSCKCYYTVIFQSFQNTFIKMHQNVNINTVI